MQIKMDAREWLSHLYLAGHEQHGDLVETLIHREMVLAALHDYWKSEGLTDDSPVTVRVLNESIRRLDDKLSAEIRLSTSVLLEALKK